MSENINNIAQHGDLLIRVGQMLRLLHGKLRGLGSNKLFERAAEGISDMRYIAVASVFD